MENIYKKKIERKKERRGVELNEMLSSKRWKNYKMMMTRTLQQQSKYERQSFNTEKVKQVRKWKT